MTRKKLFYAVTMAFLLPLLMLIPTWAVEASYYGTEITYSIGVDNPTYLTDANYTTYAKTYGESTVTIARSDSIEGLYLIFDRIPTPWQLTDPASGQTVTCGTNAFLHEYVDVASLFGTVIQELTLTFPDNTVIADIYAFSEGDLPGWVQLWQPPCEEADLLLFTSHSDDEQLFFAGILPLYAGEMGYNVQVAYIIQHFELYDSQDHQRPHEQLNGLWEVGVTNYPVMSTFPDLYSESLEGAISAFGWAGVTENDFSSYMTECIRRFKPLVVVTHDINGEYGHGTHMLCTKTLMDVLEIANDPTVHPESAEKWGTWLPEKVYLHLYWENPITLDLDIPLSAFNGKTAFQVTQDGFAHHKSQHWTWFYRWIYGENGAPITKASEITSYSPCLYGLYYTTVGADIMGGDLFENVITYAERRAQEETLPPETTQPETDAFETIIETDKETNAPETTPDDPAIPSETDQIDPISKAFICIFAVAVLFVLAVYGMSLHRLNKKRNRRRTK